MKAIQRLVIWMTKNEHLNLEKERKVIFEHHCYIDVIWRITNLMSTQNAAKTIVAIFGHAMQKVQ